MRSPTPRRSSATAGAVFLDREARLAELRAAARRARERVPEIRRVILFGSLVSGIPTPRSDADLLIEVASSPHGSARDRVPEMLASFSPLPCPLDLFVFTTQELAEPWGVARVALAGGQDLLA